MLSKKAGGKASYLAGGGGGLFGRRWRRPFWPAVEEAFLAGGVEGLFGRRWRRPFSPVVEEAFLGLPQCPHRTADFSIEDKFTTAVCVLNFFKFFPLSTGCYWGLAAPSPKTKYLLGTSRSTKSRYGFIRKKEAVFHFFQKSKYSYCLLFLREKFSCH